MTTTPSAESSLTPEQKLNMQRIERSANLLHDGEVPYLLIASPDAPGPRMKFVHTTRLGYGKDIATVAAAVGQARSQMLGIALKNLSVGLKGSLQLNDPDGKAIYVFREGAMEEPSKTV